MNNFNQLKTLSIEQINNLSASIRVYLRSSALILHNYQLSKIYYSQFKSLLLIFLVGLVTGCQSVNNTNINNNIPENKHCVKNYQAKVDYFPDKITLKYTKGFQVEYHHNYKLVTVKKPWENAKLPLQYLLVQCGTPIPKNYPQAKIISIPVQTIVTMSTTYLPHLDQLDVIDSLVGVSDSKIIYNPQIRARINQHQIISIGEFNPNIEKLLELHPDLIMTYSLGTGQNDTYPQLQTSGLKVVIEAAHLESTPLGRSEWLKFTSLFFNREAKAEAVFNQIAKQYESLVKLTQKAKNKPTVFTGFNYQGTWYVPGGKSYAAKYLTDASATYLWSNTESTFSLPLDFESVFIKAAHGDIWLNPNQQWQTWQDLIQEDQRYTQFQAAQQGKIYNNNARMNEYGGNDFWESGVANPHLVLADLIKIIHPELLPEHQLVYYQKIAPQTKTNE